MQPPPPRQYFSQREGRSRASVRLDLDEAKTLFLAEFRQFNGRDYFQEAFGYKCIDAGEIAGTVGDPESLFYKRLKVLGLWPIHSAIAQYTEDDLFDVIELLHDVVSRPDRNTAHYHSYGNCGWHIREFDREAGRTEYRSAINEILVNYGPGYELTAVGEIRELGPPDQRELLTQPLPSIDAERVDSKIEAAMSAFLHHGATVEDRRHAIRLLADAFEFLREQLPQVISRKDEGELFILANQFGIRHNDPSQKMDYDPNLWLEWMFFYYLNTIAMVVKALARPQARR